MSTTTLKSLKDLGRALQEQADAEDVETLEPCAGPCSGGISATNQASASGSSGGPALGQGGPTHFLDYNDLHDLDAISQLVATARREHYDLWWEQEQERERNRPKFSNKTPKPVGGFPARIVTGYKDLAEENPLRYKYQPNDTRKPDSPTYTDPLGQVPRSELEVRTREGFCDVDGSWCDASELMIGNRGTGMVRRISGADRLAEKDDKAQRSWREIAPQEDAISAAYPDGGFKIEEATGNPAHRPKAGLVDPDDIKGLIEQVLEDHPEIGELEPERQKDRDRILVSYLDEHEPRPNMRALGDVLNVSHGTIYNWSKAGKALRQNPGMGGRTEMQTAEIIRQLAAEGQRHYETNNLLVQQLAAKYPDNEIVKSAVGEFNSIMAGVVEEVAA
jgi:hypothetical protein